MEHDAAFEEHDALFEAAEAMFLLMRSPAVADAWVEESRVQGFTVGGICGHSVRTLARLEELLLEDPPLTPRVVAIGHLYGPAPPTGGALHDPIGRYVVDDGERRASSGQAAVLRSFVRLVDILREELHDMAPDTLVNAARFPNSAARLDDVIATRVVELVLHADDLACSVNAAWDPPPTASRVALHALLEVACGRSGDLAVLRTLGRAERADPAVFPVI